MSLGFRWYAAIVRTLISSDNELHWGNAGGGGGTDEVLSSSDGSTIAEKSNLLLLLLRELLSIGFVSRSLAQTELCKPGGNLFICHGLDSLSSSDGDWVVVWLLVGDTDDKFDSLFILSDIWSPRYGYELKIRQTVNKNY